jgi:hypothetical protein
MFVMLLVASASCIVFSPWTLWIGKFDFTIHLRSQSGAAIKSVLFDAVRRDPKRFRVEEYAWDDLRAASDFDQTSVVLAVTCSGSDVLGWELSYGERGRVLLQVEFEDGTIARRIVDVPNGRGPRETTVELP